MESDAAQLRDPHIVAEAIAKWATRRFGSTVAVESCEALSGGFDNYVHALRLRGDNLPNDWTQELVVRVRPSHDRVSDARDEIAIQNWCVDAGYPAPRVIGLLVDDWELGLPAHVALRAPGAPLLGTLTSKPFRISSTIREFAMLHARLHALDTSTWPAARARSTALTRRLALPRSLAGGDDAEFAIALERVEHAVVALERPSESVVCHGDFHPLNIVRADDRSMVVIDWTDASLDDRHSDVARTGALFGVAAIAGSSPLERWFLSIIGPMLGHRYLRAYRRAHGLDDDRLLRWSAVHLVNGWAQLVALAQESVASASAGNAPPASITGIVRRRLERTLRRLGE